jgi:hypothetical protein
MYICIEHEWLLLPDHTSVGNTVLHAALLQSSNLGMTSAMLQHVVARVLLVDVVAQLS